MVADRVHLRLAFLPGLEPATRRSADRRITDRATREGLKDKVIGVPDFRGSAKGGVKKMELWKLNISKNICYKASLNTFSISKIITAPEEDVV